MTTTAVALVLCVLAVSAYALTPSGAQISTSCNASYNDDAGSRMPTSTSNTVTVTVGQMGAVAITPTTGNTTAEPGGAGYIPVAVQNSGNGSDSFGLSVSANTSWSPKMIYDDNGDGVHQSTEATVVTTTPSLAAEASYKCFLAATAPSDAPDGTTISLTLTASSKFDPAKQAQGAYTVKVGVPPPPSYVMDWLLNGYYANADTATRLSDDYLGGEAAATPLAGQTQGGKTWTAMTSATDRLDFMTIYGASALNCAGYAATYIYSPAAQPAQLWMGSDDGLKVWLNGQNVWTNDIARQCVPDQDKVPVQLTAGWNKLLAKVAQIGGGWKLAVKVCDASGNPIPTIKLSTAPNLPPPPNDTTPPSISGISVTNITANSATVNWVTNEATTGSVRYGPTSSLGLTAADQTLGTLHTVNLTGLSAGTTYYFSIRAIDPSNNETNSAQSTFATPAPSTTPAYIRQWLMNGYYANSDSATRLSRDYLSGEAYSAPKAGLTQGGKAWTVAQSPTDILDFKSIYGSTVTYCAGYAATYIYSPAAQPAQIWMGSDDGLKVWLNGQNIWTNDIARQCVPDQDKVPVQLAAGWNRLLAKVSQGTGGWKLAVKVCDASGNGIGGIYTTPSPNDMIAPNITGAQAIAIGGSRMTIVWNTDEPSSTRVEYGTSSPTTVVASPDLVTDHAITLINLTPNTAYTFRVVSADACGNTTTSANTTERTTSNVPAQFVSEWLANGFYSHLSRTTRMDADYLGGEAVVWPRVGYVDGKYAWAQVAMGPTGYVDLADFYGWPVEGIGYVHVYVYSPAPQAAQLRMGSDDGLKVYLNGKVVWIKDVYRAWVADQDRFPISLIKGWNSLLVKSTQGGKTWGISAKISDTNGNEIPSLELATGE